MKNLALAAIFLLFALGTSLSGCFDAPRSGLVLGQGDATGDSQNNGTGDATTPSDAPGGLIDSDGTTPGDGQLDGTAPGDGQRDGTLGPDSTTPGDTTVSNDGSSGSDTSPDGGSDATTGDVVIGTGCGYTIEYTYPLQNERRYRVDSYELDTLGRTISYERDDDADGSPELAVLYSYLGDGTQVAQKIEKGFDKTGALRTWVRRTYDATGQEILSEVDKNGDGVLDEIIERKYAEDGTLILEQTRDAQTGAVLNEFVVTLTSWGAIAQKQWYQSGVLKQQESYQYDDGGHLVRFELDKNGDGTPETVNSYSYQDDGEYLFALVDYGNDGQVDERIRQSYYPEGGIATLAIDPGNTGHFRWVTSYDYYPDGTLKSRQRETDENQDGKVDNIRLETFDTSGRPLVDQVDTNADGQWDNRTSNTYGPFGIVETIYETPTEVISTTTYQYNGEGKLILLELRDGNGVLLESEARSYTSDGRLASVLSSTTDTIRVQSGTAQIRQTYHYDACLQP